MNEPEVGQQQPRFDDPARWWFLTPDGFATFMDDPVAQGYEILSRHPNFPHLLTKKLRDEIAVAWERADKHRAKQTWQRLIPEARRAFLFDYQWELHRMGLLKLAWLGPKAITFNCTEGVPSILAAVHYWLARDGLFKRASQVERDRIRISPDLLNFSINNHGDPDMVTLNWSKLVKQCKEYCTRRFADDIVAAVRTFLEKNREFRHYRKQRLARLKTREHRKRTSPAIMALACVAWDCQQEGALFQDEITTKHLEAIGRKRLKPGDPRNLLRHFRKLQRQAGFKVPPLPTGPARQSLVVVEPINVVPILYPGFRSGM